MLFKPTLIAAASLCLQACTTLSSAPQPTPISPSLTVPCPPHLQRELSTWGDLALDYWEALTELADCSARQKALAEAVSTKP